MPVSQQVLQYLIHEAKKLGKREADKWVQKQLKEHGYNALKVAERLGKKAIDGLHKLFERPNVTFNNDPEKGGFVVYPSQSNSPAKEKMSEEHEVHNMGNAPEEGGEQQVSKPHHIWRRFPNTETAALKWVCTEYLSDKYQWQSITFQNQPELPFDATNKLTATNLASGGGGTVSRNVGLGLGGLTETIVDGSSGAGGTAWSNIPTGHDFINPVLLQIRMTSPYNILKQLNGGTNMNNPSAISQPNWLGIFDQKYQYYHVLECEWELSVYFGKPWYGTTAAGNPALITAATTIDDKDFGYYIFWKYTNEDDPPTSYTTSGAIANIHSAAADQGISADGTQITNVTAMTNQISSQPCTADDYFRMGGWHHKHVMLSNIQDKKVVLEGKYRYGQCKMDIKTLTSSDAHSNATTAEGWNQTGASAAFPENLSIIIVKDNAMNLEPGIFQPCSIRMETEHVVQFKDLRSAYKFPTPAITSVNSATTQNTDTAWFWRGAAYT